MSESNNGASGKKQHRLKNVDFFIVAKRMKQEREWFVTERPTPEAACAKLKEWTGLDIPRTTLSDLRRATGLEWIALRSDSGRDRSPKKDELMIDFREILMLAHAHASLCVRIGEEVPEQIKELIVFLRKGLVQPDFYSLPWEAKK